MTGWLEFNPVVRALGLALVEFVWQGALIGAVAMLLLAALRRASPQARYVVACVALITMAAAPVVSVVSHLDQPAPGFAADVPGAVEPSLGVAAEPIGTEGAAPTVPFGLDRQLPVVVLAWAVGVVVLSVHLFQGWRRVRRIRSEARELESGIWPGRLAELTRRLGATTGIRLIESASAAGPFVIGWVRPAIVIPTSAFAGLTPSELEAILAHEVMHIRRADYLVNVVQCGIEILLFYHPAVWWVSRQIRLEREHCCDDSAAEAVGDPVSYASALVALESLRTKRRALVMAADGGDLLVRIRRLVTAEPACAPSLSGGLAMCTLFTVVLLMLGGQVGRSSEPSDVVSASASPVAGEPTPPMRAPSVLPEAVLPPAEVAPMSTATRPGTTAPRVRPISSAAAQDPASSGQFVVLVEDFQGVLPGARLRLVDAGGAAEQQAVSGANGRAVFPRVPSGSYALSVEMPGFRRVQVGVTLPPANSWLQVAMQIGSLSESVAVVAPRSPRAVGQPQVQSPEIAERSVPDSTPSASLAAIPGDPPAIAFPVRVGGDIVPPRKLLNVSPIYPPDLIAANVEGVVIVEATVSQDGSVKDPRVLRGVPALSAAVIAALQQWHYSPTTHNRQPVDVAMTVVVNFALQ